MTDQKGDLHCSSASSHATSSTSATTSSISTSGHCGSCKETPKPRQPKHPIITTSIKQMHDLQAAFRPNPVNIGKEQNWIDVYSLKSLKLTLDHVMDHCRLPKQQFLVEFPFSEYLNVLGPDSGIPPSSPQTNVNKDQLSSKKKELKLLVKFYKNRISWLLSESRLLFGFVMGSSVAVVVDSSQQLAQQQEGLLFQHYKAGLKLFIEQQLMTKKAVYFIKCGNFASPRKPKCLPFTKFEAECVKFGSEWVDSLEGEEGCNLLDGLKVALELPDLDTIFVVLSTQPNQPLDVACDYMVDKLSGENAPRLHLAAFSAAEDIQASLSTLATECHGHFHNYHSPSSQSEEEKEVSHLVQDSDIVRVREEIAKTQEVLSSLKTVEHGALGEEVIKILRELSLTEWEEDDHFTLQAPPTGDHCEISTTACWLIKNGIEGQRLNLYRWLASDAYPQLEGHVEVTDTTVPSQVYDVQMPLIPWEDGTLKYLHVDVHGLERYISDLQHFIVSKLQRRMSWLQSGSRVPFGTLLEPRLLLVVDSSYTVMGQILKLQQHFKTLLEEQLAHVKEFNLLGSGSDCNLWTSGFAEPSKPTLLEAWQWVLGISPSGTNNLLSTLKVIFESDCIFEEDSETDIDSEDVGIYLVISSMPDQSKDILYSYIEQVTSGHSARIHVIYYNTQPLADQPCVLPGTEGGKCGLEDELEDYLRKLAIVGNGRFHHFKVAGTCESDDISELREEMARALEYLEEARRILDDYKEFCRRNVPSPCEDVSSTMIDRPTSAPPLYPRQTTSSLARMNASLRKIDETPPDFKAKRRKHHFSKKNYYFYTGRGLDKAQSWDLVTSSSPSQHAPKSLFPVKEEYISSKEWLQKYGMEAVGLEFRAVTLASAEPHSNRPKLKRPLNYKHINKQGEVVELRVDMKGLKRYTCKVRTALKRYHSRLNWLNKEANMYFGVVVEKDVIFLLDVSSSMNKHLQEMKEGLSTQLNNLSPKTKRFNLVAYSTLALSWQQEMMPVNADTILDSLQWLSEVKAEGSSYVLQALKVCLECGASGIYLVTDGAADHTHEFLLNQLSALRTRYGTGWRINTVGWYCSISCHGFLEGVAAATGGRFHCYPDTACSEDNMLITREISTQQQTLAKANNFL